MKGRKPRWINIIFQFSGFFAALLFSIVVMIIAGAPPIETIQQLFFGIFGSYSSMADVLVAWVPLLLVTAGVLVTFTTGLWNIGVEGQITIGAIFSTLALRTLQDISAIPSWLVILLAMMFGILGGMVWALIVGALKTFGGVNEIFGGLGMNFVATSLTIWLIFGPWKRPGIASMSGTIPFLEQFWLPELPGLRLSVWSLIIAITAIILIYLLLGGTFFGLKLKAIGVNRRAAFNLGIPTWQYMMVSFALCGAYAGLAGSLQVVSVYHRLIPSISSGYGFLGLMVAMLINYRAVWAAPVALFFAMLNIGSIQLPIVLKLDSTLSGVIQGSLVLFVIIMEGIRQRVMKE